MVTEQEARDMDQAIKDFQKKDADAQQAQHDANIAIAQAWFLTIGNNPNPRTRNEALQNFNTIEQMLRTETDRFRLAVLRKEKEKANEKFKEVKRNSP